MLLASANDGDAIGVGVIWLIALVAIIVVIFGKHDDGKRD